MHIICVSFHSLLGRGSSVMLEVWVALSVLFMHNSVMFSDFIKRAPNCCFLEFGLIRASMGFSEAVVFLSELLFLALFLLL